MVRWAEIHLNRLKSNYYELKKLSENKKFIAVVKANAYGHGSVEVSRFLEINTDVDAFAVATFDEGRELVEGGIRKEIIVMSTPVEMGVKDIRELGLIPVVFDFDSLKLVKELKVPFQIKVDVGMGRLGFTQKNWDRLIEEIVDSRVHGVMCHFPSADEDGQTTLSQFKRFVSFAAVVRDLVRGNLMVHADNSAALRFRFDTLLTHSRIGIALYGSKPCDDFPISLKQVMEVKSRVIQVKKLPPDHGISYGSIYITRSYENVAVIAFGYADGLPRRLSNKGFVLINGKRCMIRGRVCMDMTVVCVDRLNVAKGDTATIFGEDLRFEELAGKIGIIPYEIMCGISPRVKRIFVT